MNQELLKLITILGSTLIILIGGFLIQKSYLKKKKLQQEQAYGQYSSSNSSDSNSSSEDYSNETIKSYILEYKGTYSKESIKMALVNSGNSPSDVDRYLNKFF